MGPDLTKNLTHLAAKLIRQRVMERRGVEIIGVTRTFDKNEAAFAVTLQGVGRQVHYEVWEVCFTVDGAWSGTGTFYLVASTMWKDPGEVAELDPQTFDFEVALSPVVGDLR